MLLGVRGTTLLAETMMIAITWKFLPSQIITGYNSWKKPRKFTGLTSVMLYNGVFALFYFQPFLNADVLGIWAGTIYFM